MCYKPNYFFHGIYRSKKKLEKALQQAKDDIMSLTEKLQGAQAGKDAASLIL